MTASMIKLYPMLCSECDYTRSIQFVLDETTTDGYIKLNPDDPDEDEECPRCLTGTLFLDLFDNVHTEGEL